MVSKTACTERPSDNPCVLRWEQDQASQHFSLTIPATQFERSATSLGQMKKESPLDRFIVTYVQFFIDSMHNNARVLGDSAVIRKDFYVKQTDGSLIKRVSLDGGEQGSQVQPKYSLAIEFLAKNSMGLSDHCATDVTDLHDILADSNFAGLRLWFLVFDNTVDPHEAFKRTIEKNKSFAILHYLVNQMGMSKTEAERIAFGATGSRSQFRRRGRATGEAEEEDAGQQTEGDSLLSTRETASSGVVDLVDARTAAEKFIVTDPNFYYRSVTSYNKFGDIVDFLKCDNTCKRNANQLSATNYEITSHDPVFNILHFKNWGEIDVQNWLVTAQTGNGPEDRAYVVCEKQVILRNYLRQRDDSMFFEFPFPQLVFRYGPEQCSVRDMFPRTFPWKTFSIFETRYDVLKDEHRSKLEVQRRENVLKRVQDSKRNAAATGSDKAGGSEFGHTQEDLDNLERIAISKSSIAENRSTNFWQTPFPQAIVDEIRTTTSSRLQHEADPEKEMAKGPGSAMTNLKTRNKPSYEKLKEIRVICPEEYPKLLEVYKEELLAEFVKTCRLSESDNTDAVLKMLLWFQNEEKLKVHVYNCATNEGENYDLSMAAGNDPLCLGNSQKTFYRTLSYDVPTMDISIGRYLSSFAQKALCLETLHNVANIHFVYLKMRDSLFWAYFDPDKALEEIGTRMKSPFVQLGAPGTGKSHTFTLIDELGIPGTLTHVDDMTDKSLMTGDGNFRDAIVLVDEAGAVLTQDTRKMNSEKLESFKRNKSMYTEQKNTYQVCNFSAKTGKRVTERISSHMSISMATNANTLSSGDQSLNNRCNIEITRAVERRDKNIVALVGCASSDIMQKNREIFVLRQQIEQFLFCMICKMIQTYTIPVGVNIQVGKALYDNMSILMSDKYPKLKREVRDVQRLYIQFYCAAIMDTIDLCWFSEISPFKERKLDGRIVCDPFDFGQIQAAMPAMCLCEDTAIRLITGWVRQVIHNDLLYSTLLSTATSWSGFKFEYLPNPVITDEHALGIISKYDIGVSAMLSKPSEMLPAEREYLEQIKSKILVSEFLACRTRQEGARYAETREENELLRNTITYRKHYFRVGEESVKYTDTNWIEVPSKSRAEFISKAAILLRETRQTTEEVVAFELGRASSYSITTSEVYPMYDEKGKRLSARQMEPFYRGVTSKTRRTFEPFIVQEFQGNGSGYSRCYISAHFLNDSSLESILRRVLRTFCYEGCIKRTVLIDRFAGNCPFLLQTYNISPVKGLKLKIQNPTYVDPGITDVVFTEMDGVDYEFKSCPTTRNLCTTIEGSLEEYVFKQHFKACGKPDDFDYFLPRVVNENIRTIIRSSPELRDKRAPIYPLSFTDSMAQSEQKMLAAINKNKKLLDQQAPDSGTSSFVDVDAEYSDSDGDGDEEDDGDQDEHMSDSPIHNAPISGKKRVNQPSKLVTNVMSQSIKKALAESFKTITSTKNTSQKKLALNENDSGSEDNAGSSEDSLEVKKESKSLLVKRPLGGNLKKDHSKKGPARKKSSSPSLGSFSEVTKPLTKASSTNTRTKLMSSSRVRNNSGISFDMLD